MNAVETPPVIAEALEDTPTPREFVDPAPRVRKGPIAVPQYFQRELAAAVKAFDERVANRPKLVRPKARPEPRHTDDARLALRADKLSGAYPERPAYFAQRGGL